MISIGLTGNVGSGKSTVARIWKAERGALLIDADQIGRSVIQAGSRCIHKLGEFHRCISGYGINGISPSVLVLGFISTISTLPYFKSGNVGNEAI